MQFDPIQSLPEFQLGKSISSSIGDPPRDPIAVSQPVGVQEMPIRYSIVPLSLTGLAGLPHPWAPATAGSETGSSSDWLVQLAVIVASLAS